MKFADVVKVVGSVPMTPPEDGRILYEFIRDNRPDNVLELGFAHGTSTCYMAAALDELGNGHLTSIDNQSARKREPEVTELLGPLGLESRVTTIYADTSYNWELKRLIEENTSDGLCIPRYDFCFIDGAHRWEPDGLAFFLVDKLLKPGGWILFDDIPWTLAGSTSPKVQAASKSMPEDQRTTPQVERIFALLVAQHPAYDQLTIRDRWGWAHKRTADPTTPEPDSIATAYEKRSVREDTRALLRKVRQRVLANRRAS